MAITAQGIIDVSGGLITLETSEIVAMGIVLQVESNLPCGLPSGELRDLAGHLLGAHLAWDAQSPVGQGESQGPITSQKVGEASRSFGATSTSGQSDPLNLAATKWGRRYQQIVEPYILGMGTYGIGGMCPW